MILAGAPADRLPIWMLPHLYRYYAAGERANHCVDAALTLAAAFAQFGIPAQPWPVQLTIKPADRRQAVRYGTNPRWEGDDFRGHCVLWLPEHQHVIDVPSSSSLRPAVRTRWSAAPHTPSTRPPAGRPLSAGPPVAAPWRYDAPKDCWSTPPAPRARPRQCSPPRWSGPTAAATTVPGPTWLPTRCGLSASAPRYSPEPVPPPFLDCGSCSMYLPMSPRKSTTPVTTDSPGPDRTDPVGYGSMKSRCSRPAIVG
jgi:hypothetical protein